MRKLKSVTAACEAFYAGIFCGGNVAHARGMMLPQKTDEKIDLAQFQVGALDFFGGGEAGYRKREPKEPWSLSQL